jgi:uncharacterized protein YkwD
MGDGEDYEPMNNKQTVLVILLVSILLALPATVACGALGSDGSVAALGSNSDTYTVRPGDTLTGIAARYGTTVQAMVEANADTYPSLSTNPGLINVGWVLNIPGGQSNAVVESGETSPSAPSAAVPAPAAGEFDVAAVEQEVFRLVNEERGKAGLHPLEWDPVLARVARLRSQDMVDRRYLGHHDPETGEVLVDKLLGERGYPPGGENGGKNTVFTLAHPTSAELANDRVRSWMGSPGHRENMLRSDYRTTGVGVAIYPDGTEFVATQVFLR